MSEALRIEPLKGRPDDLELIDLGWAIRKFHEAMRLPTEVRTAMLWESAKSSNVHSVGYDPTTKELQVRFRSGAIYRYAMVPQEVYDQFKATNFSGRFLNTDIKGNYEYERMG